MKQGLPRPNAFFRPQRRKTSGGARESNQKPASKRKVNRRSESLNRRIERATRSRAVASDVRPPFGVGTAVSTMQAAGQCACVFDHILILRNLACRIVPAGGQPLQRV